MCCCTRQLINGLVGGHTKGASYRSFVENTKQLGVEEAAKIARLEYNNIKAVHTFSRDHGIDCDLYSGDTVDIIYDQTQWDNAVKSVDLMRTAMPGDLESAAKYIFHTAEEAQEKFYCKGDKPIGALSYFAGSLSAYKLVIGILKLCLKKGLNLQTNTPATALHKEEDGSWAVTTERGTIRAHKVVLATNGYTGHLLESFRGVIVPLRGQITAHRPGSNMPKEGLPTTYSFIYSNGYEYMIPRPQGSKYAGDIVIGGGLVKAAEEGLYEYGTTDDTVTTPDITKWLVETTPRYFGENWGDDDPEGRIRKEWTGIMGEF
jgi:glycine/D-amino acid oxidase-like deaminating enzyme